MENVGGAQLLGDMWEAANGNVELLEDEEDDRDADGTLDGGVARNPEDCSNGKRRSSDCDLILYLSCEEVIDIVPSHQVLRPGIVVSIGLDKNTKLSAVFNRYVDFCNSNGGDRISVHDLEFVHCHLLSGNDTAEASALMKNDKILVRKIRTAQREAESERKRLQRDADRNFFQQMRHLLPDLGGSKTSDIILDCQGKIKDESGRNQQLLCTTVRAHSSIIHKRCGWLGAVILKAKSEAQKQSMLLRECSTPDDEDEDDGVIGRVESDIKYLNQEEDDDGIAVLPFPPKEKESKSSGAAEIENDEDDDQPTSSDMNKASQSRSSSPVPSTHQHTENGKLWVVLPNHSPEAVRLLLEYCYTNRVTVLGQEAFVQACKTKPHKHQGPIPPYQNSSSASRRWPNGGYPMVTFSVALAGIALAEEASLHRLSLMCEIAASQLISSSNVVEALSMCTYQKERTGNDLPRLRKAAMDVVLRSGSRGVLELERTSAFQRALEEKRAVIIPTLLQGAMEAVTSHNKSRGGKRDRTEFTYPNFDEFDREDMYKREKERNKRRKERLEQNPEKQSEYNIEDDAEDFYDFQMWSSETTKRSLKRMSHHLESVSRRVEAISQRNRLALPHQSSSGRSRSSKRRSNQG